MTQGLANLRWDKNNRNSGLNKEKYRFHYNRYLNQSLRRRPVWVEAFGPEYEAD